MYLGQNDKDSEGRKKENVASSLVDHHSLTSLARAWSPFSFQYPILPRTLASCRAATGPFLRKVDICLSCPLPTCPGWSPAISEVDRPVTDIAERCESVLRCDISLHFLTAAQFPKRPPQQGELEHTSLRSQGPATGETRATEPETPGPRHCAQLTILNTPCSSRGTCCVETISSPHACTVYSRICRGFLGWITWRSAWYYHLPHLTMLLLFTIVQSPSIPLAMTNMSKVKRFATPRDAAYVLSDSILSAAFWDTDRGHN